MEKNRDLALLDRAVEQIKEWASEDKNRFYLVSLCDSDGSRKVGETNIHGLEDLNEDLRLWVGLALIRLGLSGRYCIYDKLLAKLSEALPWFGPRRRIKFAKAVTEVMGVAYQSLRPPVKAGHPRRIKIPPQDKDHPGKIG